MGAAFGNTLNGRKGPYSQDTAHRRHLSSLTHCTSQSCPSPGKAGKLSPSSSDLIEAGERSPRRSRGTSGCEDRDVGALDELGTGGQSRWDPGGNGPERSGGRSGPESHSRAPGPRRTEYTGGGGGGRWNETRGREKEIHGRSLQLPLSHLQRRLGLGQAKAQRLRGGGGDRGCLVKSEAGTRREVARSWAGPDHSVGGPRLGVRPVPRAISWPLEGAMSS